MWTAILLYLFLITSGVIVFALWFMYVFGALPSPRRYFLAQKLPGPKGVFYFGSALDIMKAPTGELLQFVIDKFEGFDRLICVWFLGFVNVFLREPDDVQVLFNSIESITKGIEYTVLHPWLEEGLLTSTGEKWHQRRKMLTPAFHFKILEDNMSTLNANSKKLRDKLLLTENKEVILEEFITVLTLDVITKTAMGVEINAQADGQEYVKHLKTVSTLMTERLMTPYMFNDRVFALSRPGRRFSKAVQYMHSVSKRVIGERKKKFETEGYDSVEGAPSSSSGKVRRAFLDLLLEYERKNPGSLKDKDIREEVDTFMFEGHDTTSSALVFIFFNLATHPDIQEYVYQEQIDIFGHTDRDATTNDLQKMVYLEKVIKESLRLYPSVPAVSRLLEKDLVLSDGTVLPAWSDICVFMYIVHRNEKYWPDPEKFDPERFSEEQCLGRHPYAYVPFSAGPRNCIGQKFAMMELKTVVSTVIRKLKVEPVTKKEDLKLGTYLVLRSTVPVKCKFAPR